MAAKLLNIRVYETATTSTDVTTDLTLAHQDLYCCHQNDLPLSTFLIQESLR